LGDGFDVDVMRKDLRSCNTPPLGQGGRRKEKNSPPPALGKRSRKAWRAAETQCKIGLISSPIGKGKRRPSFFAPIKGAVPCSAEKKQLREKSKTRCGGKEREGVHPEGKSTHRVTESKSPLIGGGKKRGGQQNTKEKGSPCFCGAQPGGGRPPQGRGGKRAYRGRGEKEEGEIDRLRKTRREGCSFHASRGGRQASRRMEKRSFPEIA